MVQPKLTDTLTWPEIVDKIMRESELDTPKFKEWLMSKESLGGYFFNSLAWRWAYQTYHKVNHEDMDHFSTVSGREGWGKSTFAIQLACVVDPTFCLARICYKPTEFIEGIMIAKKGQAFVLDEGVLFSFSRESMSDQNKIMLKLMALMRQYNLIVFVCIPNFHLIDSYIRNHRTASLFHMHDKGKYTYYNERALRIISNDGAKFKQVGGVQVPKGTHFPGYFNRFLPTINDINMESYKMYKDAHFKDFLTEIKGHAAESEGDKPREFVSVKEASKLVPLHENSIRRMLSKGQITAKKIGEKWMIHRETLIKTTQGEDIRGDV